MPLDWVPPLVPPDAPPYSSFKNVLVTCKTEPDSVFTRIAIRGYERANQTEFECTEEVKIAEAHLGVTIFQYCHYLI